MKGRTSCVSSRKGATAAVAEELALRVKREWDKQGTSIVEISGICDEVGRSLARRNVPYTKVHSGKEKLRQKDKKTTTLDAVVVVKDTSGAVVAEYSADVRVVPKVLTPPPPPDTINVGGRMWATKNIDTSKYVSGSGLVPVKRAKTNEEFIELTRNGDAAWIYYWRPTERERTEYGRMFNRHVVISKLQAPDDFEVATKADWLELRGFLEFTYSTKDAWTRAFKEAAVESDGTTYSLPKPLSSAFLLSSHVTGDGIGFGNVADTGYYLTSVPDELFFISVQWPDPDEAVEQTTISTVDENGGFPARWIRKTKPA